MFYNIIPRIFVLLFTLTKQFRPQIGVPLYPDLCITPQSFFFLSGEQHLWVPLAQCDLRRPRGLRSAWEVSALVKVLGVVGGPGMPTLLGRAPVLPPECRDKRAASQSWVSRHMLKLKCLEGQLSCSFSLSFFFFPFATLQII